MPRATKGPTQAELLALMLAGITEPRLVVGLDLSLTSTGWARNEAGVITSGRITTEPDSTLYGSGLGARLLSIFGRLGPVIADADLVVVESPFASLGGGNEIFYVQGVARIALELSGLKPVPVTPSTLKIFACGAGNADKVDVSLGAVRRLGWEGAGNDEADAAWLSEMGWHLLDRPNVDLPGTHLRALDTARNPGKNARAASKRRVKARIAELTESVG